MYVQRREYLVKVIRSSLFKELIIVHFQPRTLKPYYIQLSQRLKIWIHPSASLYSTWTLSLILVVLSALNIAKITRDVFLQKKHKKTFKIRRIEIHNLYSNIRRESRRHHGLFSQTLFDV